MIQHCSLFHRLKRSQTLEFKDISSVSGLFILGNFLEGYYVEFSLIVYLNIYTNLYICMYTHTYTFIHIYIQPKSKSKK